MNGTKNWNDLHPNFHVALDLAWSALQSGTLGIGAVISDASGNTIATGRNQIFARDGAAGPVQGSLIAHAEINALAAVPVTTELEPCTIWATLEPCVMCLSASVMSHAGRIRFLSPDPLFDGLADALPRINDWVDSRWPVIEREPAGPWTALAWVLALHELVASGSQGKTLAAHRDHLPAVTAYVDDLVRNEVLTRLARQGAGLDDLARALGDDLERLASQP